MSACAPAATAGRSRTEDRPAVVHARGKPARRPALSRRAISPCATRAERGSMTIATWRTGGAATRAVIDVRSSPRTGVFASKDRPPLACRHCLNQIRIAAGHRRRPSSALRVARERAISVARSAASCSSRSTAAANEAVSFASTNSAHGPSSVRSTSRRTSRSLATTGHARLRGFDHREAEGLRQCREDEYVEALEELRDPLRAELAGEMNASAQRRAIAPALQAARARDLVRPAPDASPDATSASGSRRRDSSSSCRRATLPISGTSSGRLKARRASMAERCDRLGSNP